MITLAPCADGVGERIRARREGREWTLRELALRANISHASLSKIERGVVQPRVKTLVAIATALGITAIELATGEIGSCFWCGRQ